MPYPSDMDAAEAELQQELREMFAVDTQQQLETFFSTIERLNARSWQQDIQEIYRAIHTIKGGAVTVAADALLHAAIALEDLLSDLRYLEQAPALADDRLQQILLEAGELLSSSLEVTATGTEAIELVQPTVRRLTELHDRVKQIYLSEWDETKQLHQEFAEQGFELVILELEMALANLPVVGAVPVSIIDVACATIDRLTQIGNDIELDRGWHTILDDCLQLIAKPDARLWQEIWSEYFQILKICVKQSGELTASDIDKLAQIHTCLEIETELELDATLVQSELELDATLVQSELDLDATLVQSELELESNFESNQQHQQLEELPDLLDDFFADSSIDEFETLDNTTTIERFETIDDSATIDQLDSLDDSAIIDQFEAYDSATIDQLETVDDSATIELEDFRKINNKIDESSDDLPDLLDNFFVDSDSQLIPLDRSSEPDLDVSIDLRDLLDDFFPKVEDPIATDLENLPDDNIYNIESGPTETDRSTAEIRDLLDDFFGAEELELVPAPAPSSDVVAVSQSSQKSTISTPETSTVSANEATKRNIQIPVPLERLDKSAQQVVDTLLNARAVTSGSTQLQIQLNQLTSLTKESAEYVTRLRQLQDDYALLRNLSDERDAGSNVTLERYRQGYTTINRLLENILRMSELGQEIETATYHNSSRLDALDRSISRLKDGIETSRLIPFRNLTLRAKAILRDLTNRYGKPAELVAHNDRVELDAGIVQQLEPVLLHLLRNAYDHGLESTQQREAAGKPTKGTIKIAIDRLGNLYRLIVADDGGGIDRERIAQIARSKGFPLQQTTTDAELLAVLCQPGFSSSTTVSEVSGRGVGMDVVLTQITNLGGKLTLDTQLGRGTTFTIEVPAPQLLVPCVLVRVSDRIVAIPTDEVLETALMSSLAPEFTPDNELALCHWTLTSSQGRVAGYDLDDYWRSGAANPDRLTQRIFPETAICIRTRQAEGTSEIWSIADDLVGRSELLINPLPSPLVSPIGLLGVSLQPDGRMISILDPIALTTAIATAPTQSAPDRLEDRSAPVTTPDRPQSTAPMILVVDDAAMMRRRFEASLNANGFVVHTCNDGLEALNWLQTHPAPDLMITDVEMPNMDGFTLIDRCRQAQIDMPILVVSSRLSAEWGKEARRLGATDYLNKGFSTSELLQTVNSLLELVAT